MKNYEVNCKAIINNQRSNINLKDSRTEQGNSEMQKAIIISTDEEKLEIEVRKGGDSRREE